MSVRYACRCPAARSWRASPTLRPSSKRACASTRPPSSPRAWCGRPGGGVGAQGWGVVLGSQRQWWGRWVCRWMYANTPEKWAGWPSHALVNPTAWGWSEIKSASRMWASCCTPSLRAPHCLGLQANEDAVVGGHLIPRGTQVGGGWGVRYMAAGALGGWPADWLAGFGRRSASPGVWRRSHHSTAIPRMHAFPPTLADPAPPPPPPPRTHHARTPPTAPRSPSSWPARCT